MLQDIGLAFIPIFFAMDAIGILPLFVGLTRDLDDKERASLLIQSILTAIGISIAFLFFGAIVFELLGITIGDFMIAGGVILFYLAMVDLIQPTKYRQRVTDIGPVPIGTPLIVGPAVLTSGLMMRDQHGLWPTVIAMLLNIMLAGIVFYYSRFFLRVIGDAGARALSKVMALLLSAIGVMMVRQGVITMITAYKAM